MNEIQAYQQKVAALHDKTVLFFQHAGALGGSVYSLLYLVQGLRAFGVKSEVAMLHCTQPVVDLYRSHDIPILSASRIRTFEHTTAQWATISRPRSLIKFCVDRFYTRRSIAETLNLVEEVCPSLVHLNSVVLVDSARALINRRMPFVWHVRESPMDGIFGLRRSLVGKLLGSKYANPIFISNADRRAWVKTRVGEVIPNFVDTRQFRLQDATECRRNLGLPLNRKIIVYLGGVSEIKGWLPLCRALASVKRGLDEFVCIMPGTDWRPPTSFAGRVARQVLPLVGGGAPIQQFEREIRHLGLETSVVRMPFLPNVIKLLGAADFLVFPSTRPHFARPIVEAAALGKPSVASNFEGIRELLVDGRTGLLVKPNDVESLTTAIVRLLRNDDERVRMGSNARVMAQELFSAEANVSRITEVYRNIWTDGRLENNSAIR